MKGIAIKPQNSLGSQYFVQTMNASRLVLIQSFRIIKYFEYVINLYLNVP